MRNVLHQDSMVIEKTNFHLDGRLNDSAGFFRVDIKNGKSYLSKKIILISGKQKIDILLSEFPKQGGAPLKTVGNTEALAVLDSLESIRNEYYERYAKKEQGYLFLQAKDMLELNMAKIKYLQRYKGDYFTLLIIGELSGYSRTIDYQKNILYALNSSSDAVKNSPLGKKLTNDVNTMIHSLQSINIGSKVPYFNVKKDNGIVFNNASLRGKPYLLVFSATWCLPCQKELPTFKALYGKYNSKGLEIVYINLDDDVGKWMSHIKSNRISSWINVSEGLKARDSKLSILFSVNSVPAYFLVDKNEIIVADSKLEKQHHLPNLSLAISKLVF